MVFWLAILAGAFFVRPAIGIGFFKIWTMLFNIVIAVYVAVFLTPLIVESIPAAGETWYGHVLTLIAIAAGTFAVLYGMSSAFLAGEDSVSVSFPRVFEILLASFLGFLAGFLAFSFATFLICLSPISQHAVVKQVGLDRRGQQTNVSFVCWSCDLVHAVVSYPESEVRSEQVLDELEQSAQSKIQPKAGAKVPPDQPAEPDSEKTPIGKENRPGKSTGP